jgi:hypothetical protein
MRLSQLVAAAAVVSTAGSTDRALQEAAQMLDATCALLCGSGGSSKGIQQLPYKTVLQPCALQLLSLLQKHHELPPLPHLLPALCAVVTAGVAARDTSFLEAAEQLLVDSRQAAGADIMQLYWAAVAGAAAVGDGHKALLQYWTKALSAAVPASGISNAAVSAAAAAVVAAMVADAAQGGDLTQQLLAQPQPLPESVMAALLQAAMQHTQMPSGASSRVLQQLLAHAQQQQQLQALPDELLTQLLSAALSATTQTSAAVSFADCMQLLQLLLSRQTAGVEQVAAQQLVAALEDSPSNMQQFEQLVLQLEDSDVAAGLLCLLLQQACARGSAGAGLSWKLFLLLQQCSASGSDRVQQQLVQVSSGMLVQLGGSGTDVAAGRAVQVWQYRCGSTAVQQQEQQTRPCSSSAPQHKQQWCQY